MTKPTTNLRPDVALAHHGECWRDPQHHECAVALIDRWRAAFPLPSDEDEDSYYPGYGELAVAMADVSIGLHHATELLRELACSGVELDEPRMRYVVVQIGRETWEQLREAAGAAK